MDNLMLIRDWNFKRPLFGVKLKPLILKKKSMVIYYWLWRLGIEKNLDICFNLVMHYTIFLLFKHNFDHWNYIIWTTSSQTKWFILLCKRRQGCIFMKVGHVLCWMTQIMKLCWVPQNHNLLKLALSFFYVPKPSHFSNMIKLVLRKHL